MLNDSLKIEALAEKGFDVMYLSHAGAILAGDFEAALTELATVLDAVSLPITEIIGSGGGSSSSSIGVMFRSTFSTSSTFCSPRP
jgi:hypothetical protein